MLRGKDLHAPIHSRSNSFQLWRVILTPTAVCHVGLTACVLLSLLSPKSEVTLLRNEVARLKQLLLAHKDCPVTAMQKKSGYHSE